MEIKLATYQIPKLLNALGLKNNQEFHDWQVHNKYFNAVKSIALRKYGFTIAYLTKSVIV